MFPRLEHDELWELFFQLLYKQHGGSGLSLTLTDVMDMEINRIFWLIERLGDQRRREARELEQIAHRGRGRR